MMKIAAPILILGGAGRVGRLLSKVWPVDVPVIWHSRTPTDGYEHCDMLSEPERLADLARQCSAILCLPGITDKRHRDRGDAYGDNSRLAQAAIVAAHAAGCPRVFLCSSAAVYGKSGKRCTEDASGSDLSAYGKAKRDMELAGMALGQATGVKVCSLRIGNLVGADAILGGWQPGFELDTFKDGSTPTRSYLSPLALTDIFIGLARTDQLPFVLNVAQPGQIAMGRLLDAAGLAWHARPASESAIRAVDLSTDLLQATIGHQIPIASVDDLVQAWKHHSDPAEQAS